MKKKHLFSNKSCLKVSCQRLTLRTLRQSVSTQRKRRFGLFHDSDLQTTVCLCCSSRTPTWFMDKRDNDLQLRRSTNSAKETLPTSTQRWEMTHGPSSLSRKLLKWNLFRLVSLSPNALHHHLRAQVKWMPFLKAAEKMKDLPVVLKRDLKRVLTDLSFKTDWEVTWKRNHRAYLINLRQRS